MKTCERCKNEIPDDDPGCSYCAANPSQPEGGHPIWMEYGIASKYSHSSCLPSSAWLEQGGSLLTWNQRWTMFNDPESVNARHIMVAELANGEIVDVLRDGGGFDLRDLNDPGSIPAKLPRRRWMRLCIYLNFEANARYRQLAAEYRFRTWNAAHSDSEQIQLLDYLLVNAANEKTIRVAQVDPLSDGRFVDGKEDGEWVYRHRNGTVSARGHYDAGRKQGIWKTYYADGSPADYHVRDRDTID